jgi:VWFA-related protein
MLISEERPCRTTAESFGVVERTLSAALVFVGILYGQGTTTFKAAVALIHTDVEVVEEGRILTGFTKDDFRILDEGKPQPILQFSAGEEALDLILLFDISGSMQLVVSQVAAASRQAFHELRPGDRVCVMVFNTKVREIAPFTSDVEAVRKTIEDDVMGLRFRGGTFIQSAVQDAAHRFRQERRSERRRAVLIITDDKGIRTRSEGAVVRDFWESDALLSGLVIEDRRAAARSKIGLIGAPYLIPLVAGMRGIARKTGGDTIGTSEPAAAFQDAIHRIRCRYSLYYAQPEGKPGSVRSMHVELTGNAATEHPKARIRARTGYVVPKNPAPAADK